MAGDINMVVLVGVFVDSIQLPGSRRDGGQAKYSEPENAQGGRDFDPSAHEDDIPC